MSIFRFKNSRYYWCCQEINDAKVGLACRCSDAEHDCECHWSFPAKQPGQHLVEQHPSLRTSSKSKWCAHTGLLFYLRLSTALIIRSPIYRTQFSPAAIDVVHAPCCWLASTGIYHCLHRHCYTTVFTNIWYVLTGLHRYTDWLECIYQSAFQLEVWSG